MCGCLNMQRILRKINNGAAISLQKGITLLGLGRVAYAGRKSPLLYM